MVEKVVIEVTGTDNLQPTINDLEKLGKVDAANAAQFKKTNAEFKKGAAETVTSVKGITDSLKTLVPAISAAFAVQAVVAFGKASLNAFIEAERGEKLLLNALNKNEAAFKRLTEAAKKYQSTTVYDDDTIIAAQTFLATQGRTEEQINKVIRAATNLSAVTGESLQSSVEKLDATYEGSIGRLGKMDSRFKSLTQAQLENGAAIDLVAEKYKGFAEAELETTAGKLIRLQNAWGEVQEKAGAAIVDMADRIKDNTLTGGLISQLLFGQSDELKDDLLKIKLVQGAMADLNQGIGDDFENAAQKAIDKQIALDKANEKQAVTIETLAATVKKLQDELVKVPVETQTWTTKNNQLTAAQKELDKYTKKATDAIKEQKKALDDVPTEMLENIRAGQEAQLNAEAKAEEERLSLVQSGADEATRIKAEEVAERLRLDDLLAENEKKNQDEVTANLQEEARKREEIQQALSNAVSQLITMAIDYQLALDRQATDYKISLLQEQYNSEKITEEQFNQQRRAILKDQAEKEKEAAIIKATIDTANAVISSFADGGPVLAAIAAALGLAQIAIISATPIPQFEKGGRVKGKSHREGGVHAELEGEEFIINKKAARKIGFDNLEMLNKGIVPIKLLKQSLSDAKNKNFETSMMKVFGSSDFDTYPIEKELRKNRKNDTELTHLLIKQISKGSQKRGGYA